MAHEFQTPTVTEIIKGDINPPKVVSLEEKLTKHWVDHKASCEAGLINADYNLGRLALLYGGQMYFEFGQDGI